MHLLKSQTQANVAAYVINQAMVPICHEPRLCTCLCNKPRLLHLFNLPPRLWLLPMSQIQTIHLLMSQAQDNEPSYITGPDVSSTYFKSQADQSAMSQTQTVAFARGTSTNVTRPGKCICHATGFYICLCHQSSKKSSDSCRYARWLYRDGNEDEFDRYPNVLKNRNGENSSDKVRKMKSKKEGWVGELVGRKQPRVELGLENPSCN